MSLHRHEKLPSFVCAHGGNGRLRAGLLLQTSDLSVRIYGGRDSGLICITGPRFHDLAT